MRVVSAALPLSLLSSVPSTFAAPTDSLQSNAAIRRLTRRAEPDSPSGNYAPATVDCPSDPLTVHDASTLSTSETEWLKKRRPNTIEPMIAFMKQANITGFDAPGYIQANSKDLSAIPNIGISISGGGYRALFAGAGFLAAADSRTPDAPETGGIGGLLQSATYLSSLSGGAWLVGSFAGNNFSTITSLRDGSPNSTLWKFASNIFQGPPELGTEAYFQQIDAQVNLKHDAGYGVSFTDYYGRMLSYQFFNASQGGPDFTFSSVADDPTFASGNMPFPIITIDERQSGLVTPTLESTVYEINPYDFGSFDPTVHGFVPTKYLGSDYSHGSVSKKGKCVRGFDQIGFVIGTSSSLFNEDPFEVFPTGPLPPDVMNTLVSAQDGPNGNVAQFVNPFYKYGSSDNEYTHSQLLPLLDGGEDLETIPFQPLIQPLRAVDVVFAVGSGAETEFNYPNGTDLRATYERSLSVVNTKKGNGKGKDKGSIVPFPVIPDANTFINLGLNKRPTFFGCNASDFADADNIPPIIVFIPVASYNTFGNMSTADIAYSDESRNALIENGFNMATMGNGTIEAQWPACAACAVLSRSLDRTGTPLPEVCKSCFELHCWNGTVDTSTPATYNPPLLLPQTA